MCVNFAEEHASEELEVEGELGKRGRKIVERITLEMYCQYELSLAFREPVPTTDIHYHNVVRTSLSCY